MTDVYDHCGDAVGPTEGAAVDVPAPPSARPGAAAVAGREGQHLDDAAVAAAVVAAKAAGWPSHRPMTRLEAAQFLGRSQFTLADWARSGQGPRFRMDCNRAFYEIEELIRWRASHLRRRGRQRR